MQDTGKQRLIVQSLRSTKFRPEMPVSPDMSPRTASNSSPEML